MGTRNYEFQMVDCLKAKPEVETKKKPAKQNLKRACSIAFMPATHASTGMFFQKMHCFLRIVFKHRDPKTYVQYVQLGCGP